MPGGWRPGACRYFHGLPNRLDTAAMASSPFANSGKKSAAVVAPQHYVSPTSRELRAQAVHRLQVGLFGLAAMLLLVGLANIIMDRARVNDDATAEAAASSAAAEGAILQPTPKSPASDPLADIGVVPDLPAAPKTNGVPPADSSPTSPTGQ